MEEPNNAIVQFQWGSKRGVGGAKKDVQFYESFIFDGVHYTLYDDVYLFKKERTEPYIGKIIKIWEQGDGKKKVKILWFFEPCDVLNCLGDYKPMEKEIFLASGEGVGLTNINPLEAISAKCSVVCASDDARNPQPAKDALDAAAHVFFRTFDVGKLTVCENLPDKIVGIEIKSLLNRKEVVDAGGADISVTHCTDEIVHSLKHKAESDISNGKPVKKMRMGDISEKNISEMKQLVDAGGANISVTNDTDDLAPSLKHKAQSDISNDKPVKKVRMDDISGKKQVSEERLTSPNESLLKEPPTTPRKNPTESEYQPVVAYKPAMTSPPIHHDAIGEITTEPEHQIVVTRKPDADRSKWFKGLSWDGRLQKANQLGTLVLLQNFDRSVTSRDIEDTIYHNFKHSCTVKTIPLLPPYHNPHHGQAYVIFKTQDAADEAINKINKGCLTVQNKRALVATKGMLKMPEKTNTLTGHLGMYKFKKIQREEMRRAVSTSHCSQPNTIEYEMAMDWILLQEKTSTCCNRLYKRQNDEGKKVGKHIKSDK